MLGWQRSGSKLWNRGSWHSKNWDCAMEVDNCGDGAFSKDVKGTGKGSWHSSNWLDEDKAGASSLVAPVGSCAAIVVAYLLH